MTRPNTYDSESHQEYLKGVYEANPLEKEGLDRGREHLEAVVKRNQKFARALGELSYTLVNIAKSGWYTAEEVKDAWRRAKILAHRAVELDPHDYINHWNIAHYLVNTGDEADFNEGITYFERALELFNDNTDPMERKPGLLAEFGEILVYGGNVKRGIDLIEKATKVPDWYFWNLSFARYCDRDFKGAIAALDQMRQRPGDAGFLFPSLLVRAAAAAQLGDTAGAEHAIKQFRKLSPDAETAKHMIEQELKAPGFQSYRNPDAQRQPVKKLAKLWVEGLEKALKSGKSVKASR